MDLIKAVLVTMFLVLALCQAKPAPQPASASASASPTRADRDPASSPIAFQAPSQSPYGQWDLAIAHGDNISLITFDKNTAAASVQEILIPFPVNSTASIVYQNRYAAVGDSGTTNLFTTPPLALVPQRPFGQIDYIATDPIRQLIFYTYLYEQPAVYRQRAVRYRDLNAYSLITKESVRLAHAINNNASFDDLLYSGNTLYWIDAKSQHVMQLRLDSESSSAVSVGEPTPYINLALVPGRHVTFDGLAIDPSTGFMYFGAWGSPSFGKSAIYCYNGNSSRLLLSHAIHSPTSLIVAPDSYLYWVNKPSWNKFAIERVKLTADIGNENEHETAIQASRQQVHSGQRQHWFAFTISCTSPRANIFYTDIMSKSLYQLDPATKQQLLIKNYYPSIPQGLVASHPAWISDKNPLCSPRASTGTITSATANMPSSSTFTSTEISTINNNVKTNGPNSSASSSNEIVFYSCSPDDRFSSRCLNGGSCISAESDSDVLRTHCLCTSEWTGPTCEINMQTDTALNVNDNGFIGLNHRSRPSQTNDNDASDSDSLYKPVIITLSVSIGVFVVIIGVLSVKICMLTRKPKIRRRVVVRPKNRATGDKANTGADVANHAVCELIDIENCCNMNVCDTPCYDSGIMKSEHEKKVFDNGSMGSDSDIAASVTGDDKQLLIV